MSEESPPPREDPRSTEELFQAALRGALDDEAAWEAVQALHARPTREVLEGARRLCASADPRERARGADILGQLGTPETESTFVEERLSALLEVLATASEPEVLQAAAVALGHLHDARAIPALVKLQAHPDAEVRYGVVHGLHGHPHPEAISALIELSTDADEDVRNWATFGLGSQLDTDTPELRAALWQRTEDSHDETRGEALLGLARRKDARALPRVLRALAAGSTSTLEVEAAGALGDPSLVPALRALRERWEGPDWTFELIDEALARCAGQGASA